MRQYFTYLLCRSSVLTAWIVVSHHLCIVLNVITRMHKFIILCTLITRFGHLCNANVNGNLPRCTHNGGQRFKRHLVVDHLHVSCISHYVLVLGMPVMIILTCEFGVRGPYCSNSAMSMTWQSQVCNCCLHT